MVCEQNPRALSIRQSDSETGHLIRPGDTASTLCAGYASDMHKITVLHIGGRYDKVEVSNIQRSINSLVKPPSVNCICREAFFSQDRQERISLLNRVLFHTHLPSR